MLRLAEGSCFTCPETGRSALGTAHCMFTSNESPWPEREKTGTFEEKVYDGSLSVSVCVTEKEHM